MSLSGMPLYHGSVSSGEVRMVVKRHFLLCVMLALSRLIPGARLMILPRASFFAMWQQPAAFNGAVLDFLASAQR
jgi:pimeloyl-ACP methyl ester carboxylesterase